jgi:hypothetical protein
MLSNLPPTIQDWISNLSNKSTPMNIRYNYFSMINNAINEMQVAANKFQKELDKQPRR